MIVQQMSYSNIYHNEFVHILTRIIDSTRWLKSIIHSVQNMALIRGAAKTTMFLYIRDARVRLRRYYVTIRNNKNG